MGLDTPGVIFDDAGEGWPTQSPQLAQRLACGADGSSVIDYALRERGYVCVIPIRDALFLTFEPSVVSPLAAFAAFYEISARAPKLLILAHPEKAGQSDRYEVFNNVIDGLRRLEAAAGLKQVSQALNAHSAPIIGFSRHRDRGSKRRQSARASTIGATDRCSPAGDHSARLSRPLASISADDKWFGQLLRLWGNARNGRRLPSSESLDPFELLNIACGRAHMVETSNSNPAGYRFRLWGAVNSYGNGYSDRTLGEMPAGLMRDGAIADYRQAVATGIPHYHLIAHIENKVPYSYARLLLPLAQDGRRVDRLIVLINERGLPEFGAP